MRGSVNSSRQFWGTVLCAALIMVFFSGSVFAAGKKYRVAFFAASSRNGFNQAVYDGITRKAKELGNVETAIYDGEFSASIQYSQIEDVIASGKFDAFILVPNDTVGIAPVIEEAIDAGIKVGAAYFPIGPNLTTLEPQIKGLTVTVGHNPAYGAALQAEKVAKFCSDKDPCNVAIMIGQKIYPFDNVRYNAYRDVLKKYNNIKVRAVMEGNYDPDKSMGAMQDTLQANKNIHAVLSNADQHLIGAEIALSDAGYKLEDMFLSGGGGCQIAVDAVREGRWTNTVANFPRSYGEKTLQALIDALEGKKVNPVIDMDKDGPIDLILDKETLKAHPKFKAEWQG